MSERKSDYFQIINDHKLEITETASERFQRLMKVFEGKGILSFNDCRYLNSGRNNEEKASRLIERLLERNNDAELEALFMEVTKDDRLEKLRLLKHNDQRKNNTPNGYKPTESAVNNERNNACTSRNMNNATNESSKFKLDKGSQTIIWQNESQNGNPTGSAVANNSDHEEVLKSQGKDSEEKTQLKLDKGSQTIIWRNESQNGNPTGSAVVNNSDHEEVLKSKGKDSEEKTTLQHDRGTQTQELDDSDTKLSDQQTGPSRVSAASSERKTDTDDEAETSYLASEEKIINLENDLRKEREKIDALHEENKVLERRLERLRQEIKDLERKKKGDIERKELNYYHGKTEETIKKEIKEQETHKVSKGKSSSKICVMM